MLVRLDGTVTVRMSLPQAVTAASPKGVEIREVGRDELHAVFAGSALAPGTLFDLDAIAPLRWRCFAAFEDDHPIHHSFVAYRSSTGPELFRVLTAPSHRRRGAFVAVVSTIAQTLSREHEIALCSKLGIRNPTSLLAHRAAGFVVVRRRYEPMLLGFNIRLAASNTWHRLRRRPLR